MNRARSGRRYVLVLAALAALGTWRGLAQTAPTGAFARQIRELSEPGGSFDTDNLISNERSYLHVIPGLKRTGPSEGAYIGVGPEQNFSYIAAVRPAVAYIIDVRRDNLLLQLLFKALFEISETRADYLAHLFGKRVRAPAGDRGADSLERLAAQIDSAPADDGKALEKEISARIATFGVPLSEQDRKTIQRFHQTFIDSGLSLKFQSYGRAPRSYYPSYRDLLLETDPTGRQANFLASEDDYQLIRGMQMRDAIVPVVGDLAGPTALAAIGRAIRQRGETVSAFYVSNVELYLFQNGVFPKFAETVSMLPHSSRSLLIRSVFNGPGIWPMPEARPGYVSVSLLVRLDDFIADYHARRYLNYSDLITTRH